MRRDLCVMLQLGFGFFCIFSAFNSQGFIEISVLRSLSKTRPGSGINENSGYYSLAIIYLVFTFSNFLAPPIIYKIGSKWSQVIGGICYTVFMFAFLRLSGWLLFAVSALLGFGAAVLWTGQGVYLVEHSRDGKMPRNAGIIWAMLQSSLVAGGIFLRFVLQQSDLVSSFELVYSVFCVAAATGVLVLAFLPSLPDQASASDDTEALMDDEDGSVAAQDVFTDTEPAASIREQFEKPFKLLRTPLMMTLSVCFMYSGIEVTFLTGIYSACLAASTSINKGSEQIIAYNALAIGAGQIIGGLAFGLCAVAPYRTARGRVVMLGTILHLVSFFLVFLNVPADSPLHKTSAVSYIEPSEWLALITGFMLGLGDACWNTQIYTLLGDLYKDDSPSAFALYKFFQSLSACISFFYGASLLLHWQLLILCVGVVLGALSFFEANLESQKRATAPIE